MKTADMIRQALLGSEITTVKQLAKSAGVSYECLRTVLKHNRIPKDSTIIRIAESLGLDQDKLLLAAHREKMSDFAVDNLNLLTPIAAPFERKRVWPLSHEQCEYLRGIMSPAEIQLIRKYRQITAEGRISIQGYIDFMFMSHREKTSEQQSVA